MTNMSKPKDSSRDAPGQDESVAQAIKLTQQCYFPDAGRVQSESTENHPDAEGLVSITAEDLEAFIREVVHNEALVVAEERLKQHADCVQKLRHEMGIDQPNAISIAELRESLAQMGIRVRKEIVDNAAEKYQNRKENEEEIATWKQKYGLPISAGVAALGREAAISEALEHVRSSVYESILQALASPGTIRDGECAILFNKEMLQRGTRSLEEYSNVQQWMRSLSINHGIRINDEYSIILRIPFIGRRETFELLSPETRETVAKPEPKGFFGRVWYLLSGPTMEVVHPEKRGRPVTSPSLRALCETIERAGGVPRLRYLSADTPGFLNVRLSIGLDNS